MMNPHLVGMASHAFIFSPGGEMLVIQRDGSPYLRGYWSVPAGHVEAGETAVAACVREIREEVGLCVEPEDLRFVLVQQKSGADGEERVDFFFTTSWPSPEHAFIASPREIARLKWCQPNDLPEPFAPYVRAAIESVQDGTSLLASWDL